MLLSSTVVLTDDWTTAVEACVGKASKQEERTDRKHSRALKMNKKKSMPIPSSILWGPSCVYFPLNKPH